MLTCYDFIGMNPFEKRQDLVHTIQFIKQLPEPFFIYNNNLAFYPGTKLHEQALKHGLNISKRDKHGDANVGYAILRREKIRHKIFHFLLLMMAGKATKSRIGFIPRFMVSGPAIRLYTVLDRNFSFFSDGFIAMAGLVLMHADWRVWLKKLFGRKQIGRLRAVLAKIKKRQHV
jgi:hypothetical protein